MKLKIVICCYLWLNVVFIESRIIRNNNEEHNGLFSPRPCLTSFRVIGSSRSFSHKILALSEVLVVGKFNILDLICDFSALQTYNFKLILLNKFLVRSKRIHFGWLAKWLIFDKSKTSDTALPTKFLSDSFIKARLIVLDLN